MQQTGINKVAMAATHATAENPPLSKAEAEIVAIAAIPTCDAAFRTAIYSPRTSGPTISVVRACRGAWRADAAMLNAAIPTTRPIPRLDRATITNRNDRMMFAEM